MSVAVIVLCAGQGTRMKSEKAKVLHELCDKPLCAWPIDAALKVKPAQIIAVVGHQAKQVQQALEKRYENQFDFVLQKEQKGTAHAVKLALKVLKPGIRQVVVLYGDTPFLTTESIRSLLKLNTPKTQMSLLTAEIKEPSGYGRIVREGGLIKCIVEHKDASPQERKISEVNPGFYAFKTEYLKKALPKVKKSPATGEYYLTELVRMAACTQKDALPSKKINSVEMQGINTRVQLSQAECYLREKINHVWMLKGVSMLDPKCTYVGADVHLSKDVTLWPGVCISGKSKIGSNSTIYAHSCLENVRIDTNVSVGPFARLRPGAKLEANSKVGNFVEVKQSTLCKGAKAGHLAYIGDATIGSNSNVGAGTITCNYDGKHKHQTVLGENVFIGSNSTLVAPVKVDSGAYIAAGSVVTKNVETDALVFGRAKQVSKAGYAKVIRKKWL